MSATWAMNKALSELMQRHAVELAASQAVPLSEPASGPMLLSGLASTLDVDAERVAFAPFAFGTPLPDGVALCFDHHGDQRAGRIELLGYDAQGALTIRAYVDHLQAVRCNAFSVSGDVESFTLHDTGSPNFYARVEKLRLREISLVPSPANRNAKVLRREPPTALSKYIALSLEGQDLMIRRTKLIQQGFQLLGEMNHVAG